MRQFADLYKANLEGNPYWASLTGRREGSRRWTRPCPRWKLSSRRRRLRYIRSFAHTVSDPWTLKFVLWMLFEVRSEADGVVSIGAGTGYWEALLALHGYRVDAFDIAPPDREQNEYHDRRNRNFYPVGVGGPEKAAEFPHRVLMLAWPPPSPGDLAFKALSAYQGEYLLYIGALLNPRQNGDDDFFIELLRHWEMVAGTEPVRWRDSKDYVVLFKRIRTGTPRPWLLFDNSRPVA